MSGPKTKRLDTTPQPGLTPDALGLLKSLFGGMGAGGAGGLQTSGQQRNIFSNLQNVFGLPNPMQDFGGQNVLNAAQPVFQRNLDYALSANRESGPRFSSGQQLLGQQTSLKALQDFNLFSQNVLQQGQQQQLQALAQQMGFAAPFVNALFQGGGIFSTPQFEQSPGFLGSIAPILGSGLGLLSGGLFGGGGGRSSRGGGGQPPTYSGDPSNPFGAGAG